MTTCSDTRATYGDNYVCGRTPNHLGSHQQVTDKELVTWSNGGSSAVSIKDDDDPYTCARCGAVEIWHWSASLVRHELDVCFACNFWLNIIAMPEEKFIIDGHCYIPRNSEGLPRSCKGFGGARFTVVRSDGSQVTTTDMWTQGRIPEHFRDVLADNATFGK